MVNPILNGTDEQIHSAESILQHQGIKNWGKYNK